MNSARLRIKAGTAYISLTAALRCIWPPRHTKSADLQTAGPAAFSIQDVEQMFTFRCAESRRRMCYHDVQSCDQAIPWQNLSQLGWDTRSSEFMYVVLSFLLTFLTLQCALAYSTLFFTLLWLDSSPRILCCLWPSVVAAVYHYNWGSLDTSTIPTVRSVSVVRMLHSYCTFTKFTCGTSFLLIQLASYNTKWNARKQWCQSWVIVFAQRVWIRIWQQQKPSVKQIASLLCRK